jgi:hypothetical protein
VGDDGEEGDDGVIEVRGVGVSEKGVGLVRVSERCEVLGLMPDVSKLMSGPSGASTEAEVEGLNTEES